MDVTRCYEVLELGQNASIEEVRQAYRDLLNVWHPDRFGNNLRLVRKAEEKAKEINEAYEMLTSLLSEGDEKNAGRVEKDPVGTGHCGGQGDELESKTEEFAEAGTRFFLTASSHLMKLFRRWIDADGT